MKTKLNGFFTLLLAFMVQIVFAQVKTEGTTNVINVVKKESAKTLQEVVVNGLGVKIEKQALGCAISNVSSNDIEPRSEANIARIASSKASSGVQIQQQSSISGSSTSISILCYNPII